MKDFERLMRGAHDGRKRKLPGDIYDQAAKGSRRNHFPFRGSRRPTAKAR